MNRRPMFIRIYSEPFVRPNCSTNRRDRGQIMRIATPHLEINDFEAVARNLLRISCDFRGTLTLCKAEVANLVLYRTAQQVMRWTAGHLTHNIPQCHLQATQYLTGKARGAAGTKGLEQSMVGIGHQASIREWVTAYAQPCRTLQISLDCVRRRRSDGLAVAHNTGICVHFDENDACTFCHSLCPVEWLRVGNQ